MRSLATFASCAALLACASLPRTSAAPPSALTVTVEAEEEVYSFQPANNGAGPLWCSGSTSLARSGDQLFASGLETITNSKPLNNCRWTLFERGADGWHLRLADPEGRTREPCPIAAFPDGTLFLSANPTLTARDTYSGPARPEILRFPAPVGEARLSSSFERLLPVWQGEPQFSEHSYRSLAADGERGELILFQNIGYTQAEWSFRDRTGAWSAQGKLPWPDGKDYPKPQPIRVCYPNVALQSGAVHFCGVSDIVEPYPEWRAFKKQLTGQEWDYDFRRLFYTWTPTIGKEPFRPWVEIATRDKTCGWISPGDLWVAPDGAAHLVWTERALDERLREKFFPDAKQSVAINYAIVRDGKVALRKTLISTAENGTRGTPGAPRFQVTPENRLLLCYYFQGHDPSGKAVSENRLLEIGANGEPGPALPFPLKKPFTAYFTATPRAGSPRSWTLEMLGTRDHDPNTISYARIRVRPAQ